MTQLPPSNRAVGRPLTFSTRPVDHVQPATRRVVTRPTPKTQTDDAREFQIGQIRRRFSAEVKHDGQTTSMMFRLRPSDPDFPFELDGLLCTLTVPERFPGTGKPGLRVSNPEMERGYQINVERGFAMLVDQFPQKSLLGLMNELDKQLEKFLRSEKAATVKIITQPKTSVSAPMLVRTPAEAVPPATMSPTVTLTFSPRQLAEASAKRESDIRQLEARMGRQPLFSKRADGTSFNVPLHVPQPDRLPLSLQSLNDVTLLVPLLYNLEPCTVLLNGAESPEARRVEAAFERKAGQQPDLSLIGHLNRLAQNMHVMLHEAEGTPRGGDVTEDVAAVPMLAANEAAASTLPELGPIASEKPHVQVIPRPPEWSTANQPSDEDESSDLYDSEDEVSDNDDGGIAVPQDSSTTGPETGVLLSFPSLELHGIELLKLALVAITVKCDRCKTTADVENIPPQKGDDPPAKTASCQKCANSMSVRYRGELMHTNSLRAGYFDLEGCTVVDLLPSSLIPTCSDCSTDYLPPEGGVVSVRGDTTLAMCRKCHHKMSFKIPEVKFLRVSNTGVSRPDAALPRKKAREKLGIVAGQELPHRGRCPHYSKSYRWFRFSCCSKVYPCDRCHDAVEEHPNEHANRMICGFCSREQAYRPEDCGLCHGVVVGKRGSGFWEGGKGTRDKSRMSRKDPRKYKKRGGGAMVGGAGKQKGK